MAAVTSEELRSMLSDYMAPMREDLTEIKTQVKQTNGRVGVLEKWRIERDAREDERAKAAALAAALVASQASATLESHERSRTWKIGAGTLVFTALSVGTPVVSSTLHHFGIL